MALVTADRVYETSTTTGTGTYTLAGAKNSTFQAFSAVCANNDTVYYCAFDTVNGGWETGIGTWGTGGTLARTTVQTSSNANAAVSWAAGTREVFLAQTAASLTALHSSTNVVNGRLTLSSGVPVTTSDVTGATTVYWTPYKGNQITLWNGVAWATYTFSEVSLALGTLTSGMNYDVFGYQSGGALALELLAWTSDTVRATAITIQDGRYCKSGDKTRLYLGTIRTTSTTTTEDSGGGTTTNVGGKRFLWNYYNRVSKPMAVIETANTWSYTTDTWRQANAQSGNKVEYVSGLSEDSVCGTLNVTTSLSATTRPAKISIGLDSTSSPSKFISTAYNSGATFVNSTNSVSYQEFAGVGYHYLSWLEKGGAGTQSVFIGDDAGTQQSGLAASICC